MNLERVMGWLLFLAVFVVVIVIIFAALDRL